MCRSSLPSLTVIPSKSELPDVEPRVKFSHCCCYLYQERATGNGCSAPQLHRECRTWEAGLPYGAGCTHRGGWVQGLGDAGTLSRGCSMRVSAPAPPRLSQRLFDLGRPEEAPRVLRRCVPPRFLWNAEGLQNGFPEMGPGTA